MSARKTYVDIIASAMKPTKKFEFYTTYFEFYRILRDQFHGLGFEKDFTLFEENKVSENGKIPNLILKKYLQQHLFTSLIERDLKNLNAAISNNHGNAYSGFYILENFMELTIGDRSTFFE
ncbi:hypothetical protein CANINC_003839, partial [Pichia inconspicua]